MDSDIKHTTDQKMTGSEFFAKKMWDQNIFFCMRMENRNVTFPQTKQILDGINDPNVSISDITAIIDSRDAWKFLLNNLDENNTLDFACKINEIVAAHEALVPGSVRTGNVMISGIKYVPAVPSKKILERYNSILNIDSIEKRSVELFCHVTRNQIFWDGNKRTGFLVANKELISADRGVLCVDIDKYAIFNRLLSQFYETGDNSELCEFMCSQIKIV